MHVSNNTYINAYKLGNEKGRYPGTTHACRRAKNEGM